jgi:hypothetical protein
MIPEVKVKTCSTCKHVYRGLTYVQACSHPKTLDKLNGFLVQPRTGTVDCVAERRKNFGACGVEGKLWEPKDVER